MRKLTKEEIRWIQNELLKLNIEYFEVHSEIYDHIITSAEAHLKLDPNKSIEELYFKIVADELDGYTGIQKMQKQRLKLFKQKLNKQFKTNLIKIISSHKVLYLLLFFLLFTLLFKLGKNTSTAILAVSFLIAWLPDIYLYVVHYRKRQNYKQRIRIRKSLTNTYTNYISRIYYTLNIGTVCILTISNPYEKSLLEHIGFNLISQLALSAFFTFLFLIAINIIETIKDDYKNLVELAYS